MKEHDGIARADVGVGHPQSERPEPVQLQGALAGR